MHRGVRLASKRAILAAIGSITLIVAAGWGSEACRDATQVTVDIRTLGIPCSSLKGVAIVVARAPQEAEDRMGLGSLSAQVERGVCEGERVGTLVLTPSEARGAILIAARTSDDPAATCKPPLYKGCIVARRSFTFLDHVSVTLPITLEVACADVPCDVVSSCRSGTCVSSETSCSEGTQRCESPAEPIVLPDGGIDPPDAARDGAAYDGSTPGDGGPDAPTDAPADAPSDGSVSHGDGATNVCPVNNGSRPDCVLALGSGGRCCATPSGASCIGNAGACTVDDPIYACTGAAHCPAASFCCVNGMVIPAMSACATACAKGVFLCQNEDDCPSPLHCNQPGPMIGTMMHAHCGP